MYTQADVSTADIDVAAIPQELKALRQWMGTKLTRKPNGRLNKPPYCVRAGEPVRQASKTDPKHHATFEEAKAALEAGRVDAIGFVLTEDDPFCILDFDNAVNLETGELAAEASRAMDEFVTYWEYSISLTGLHAVLRGTKPGDRCGVGNLEVYDHERFIVITGFQVPQTPPGAEVCQEELDALYHRTFEAKAQKAPPRPPQANRDALPGIDELVRRARRSKTGGKFRKLFDNGDISDYQSNHSRADMALISMLIFWAGGDRDLVVEMFEQSALYRPPPEKHRGYVGLSVDKALAAYSGNFYSPKAIRELPKPNKEAALAPFLELLLDPARWTGRKGASAFKVYAAAVSLAVERGVKSASDELRIGADLRTLAERAGMDVGTLSRSTLPYLTKDLKLMKWTPGVGSRAGGFVLPRPKISRSNNTKVVHAFSVVTTTKNLEMLKQLIRMRPGRAQGASIARLGPLSMFVLVSLVGGQRAQTLDELSQALGRDKYQLRKAMNRLTSDDVRLVNEPQKNEFVLSADFEREYRRVLKNTRVTRSEERQRKRHAEERQERERKLRSKERVDVQQTEAKPERQEAEAKPDQQEAETKPEPEAEPKRQEAGVVGSAAEVLAMARKRFDTKPFDPEEHPPPPGMVHNRATDKARFYAKGDGWRECWPKDFKVHRQAEVIGEEDGSC